ncbi:MAG: alanine racemase, partial [Chloroflexi bacterium]
HELYSTWTETDLQALKNNIRCLRDITGVRVMAVVKANGYGHGAIPMARSAIEGGAAWLGVARIEEALELRYAKIQEPILLLGYTPLQRFREAIENGISLTVWDKVQVDAAEKTASSLGKVGLLHLKVDTGMNRLGVKSEEALEMAAFIRSKPNLLFEGIFTHFARADEADRYFADTQEKSFTRVVESLEKENLLPPWVHACNSAGALACPGAAFNMVRAGISIYGLHPSPQCPLPDGFQPVLSWKSVISAIKYVEPGQGVSYGHIYVCTKREKVGTVPVGYADGFRRVSGNEVLVAGKRAPVIGRVCMDQLMISLDHIPEANTGDEVVLLGKQGEDQITAEEIAARWGTINYEVTCGIGARVPRLPF